MGHMKYDFAGMDDGVLGINEATGKLVQIESDIKTAMVKLRGAWREGTDLEACNQYQNAWDQIFADVHLALKGLGNVMSVAIENGQEVQRVNTSMFPG